MSPVQSPVQSRIQVQSMDPGNSASRGDPGMWTYVTRRPGAAAFTLTIDHKPRLHEHQVPNPDSNLDHNLHGRGGLSPDLNPLCLRVNATSLDQDLDQNARVNGG